MRGGKGKNGLLPSSLRIISSCLKTVSSNAGSVASTVRSAGASVSASIAAPAEAEKDQHGYRQVLLETDSLVAVRRINSTYARRDYRRNLIIAIRKLLEKDWIVSVKHVHREANICVDFMATHFDDLPLRLHMFDEPPSQMAYLLLADPPWATCACNKYEVLWVGFDKLELGPTTFRHVLLLGYSNGFQVVDVEDAADVCELVSKRDCPVTFLQMLPLPSNSQSSDGFRAAHPLLLVVAGDESNGSGTVQGGRLSAFIRENGREPQQGNHLSTSTVVRFYSMKSHSYVHVLRFRSTVYIVRCSPRIIAVALAAQIYCFDAVTLDNRFSVLTYPLQGSVGSNFGYGPMAIGPRWLAYSPNNPLLSNTGRLSPQNLTPSPGVSPSTSPGNGSLVARYAMESSKQLAAGILNFGDIGYKTISKYCHELLPDGSSSPLSSSSGRRIGRHPSLAHPSELDNAGMVVVKDFVSKDTVSQFRAHTSPISALSFDPSGTLLVTASVNGHNINVFRIMPVSVRSGSSSGKYDWSSSHVHLYKLYRGLTAAVIQDICFSHCSQWVAIVSSRGTCHVFALSPFGGDVSLERQSLDSDRPLLIPNLSLPWWSSSCTMDCQFLPPPSPVTLTVVSRIKNGNSGWLNTVNNVAASAAGKMATPSGAMAAVFHNCICHNTLPLHPTASSLEHLLVYSPSGHVIQHELLPSSCTESSGSSSITGSGPPLQLQDEELRVNTEPVQWWDVCRRSNWPEREENISRIYGKEHNYNALMDTTDFEDNDTIHPVPSIFNEGRKNCVKSHARKNWYLSNAEVMINSRRNLIWQKPEICFYMVTSLIDGGRSASDGEVGEIEIERLPVNEIEIRRKDLLPVFEQFCSSQANRTDRVLGTSLSTKSNNMLAGNSNRASLASGSNNEFPGYVSSHLESISVKSASSSDLTMQPELVHANVGSVHASSQRSTSFVTKEYLENGCASHSGLTNNDSIMDGCVINAPSSSPKSLSYAGRTVIIETYVSSSSGSEVSSSCITPGHAEQAETANSHNSEEFKQYFHEGYCKVSELDDCHGLTEAVMDGDSSSSHCEREKSGEDGDNDDMFGGVFAFSEEG